MPRRLIAALVALVLSVNQAAALSLLRDADMERGLRELARPVLTAAGLSPGRVRVLVVNDGSLNAFVVDTRHILINSGLILKMESADELQAVIAHEAAHIANGHFARRAGNQRTAGTVTAIGAALAAAGALLTGRADIAGGVALGTASSAQRVFFGHTRAEESAADQAALRYLSAAGIDPGAMERVFEHFRGQELLGPARQDPYARTHPLSADRIRAVRGYAAAAGAPRVADRTAADYWFARAQGKLAAYVRNPSWTLRRVKKSDRSEIALIRKAMAYHRVPDRKKAMREVDLLVRLRPNDPYVLDLKGQIQLENGEFAAAARTLARALELAPNEPLIQAAYGRALLAQDTPATVAAALKALQAARARDGSSPRLLRDLAVAYARTGNNGMASVTTAERYALLGQLDNAEIHARRASGLLPVGSPGYQRAEDILTAARRAKARR